MNPGFYSVKLLRLDKKRSVKVFLFGPNVFSFVTVHEAAVDAGETGLADAAQVQADAVAGAPVRTVQRLDDGVG